MSDEAVSPDDVRHVAALARVTLDDQDVETFTEQFADILASFDTLDSVPEVDRDADLVNVMRPDEPHEPLERSAAITNATESEDGYFKGPNVS